MPSVGWLQPVSLSVERATPPSFVLRIRQPPPALMISRPWLSGWMAEERNVEVRFVPDSTDFQSQMPPRYTVFTSVGWQTIVLSYQPCAPSQFGSVPLSNVRAQLVPPFVDIHSSERLLPSAEAYTRVVSTGEIAISNRPGIWVMPVLTSAQVRPPFVERRIPPSSIVANWVLKLAGFAMIWRIFLTRPPPPIVVLAYVSVQVAPPSVERKMLDRGFSDSL